MHQRMTSDLERFSRNAKLLRWSSIGADRCIERTTVAIACLFLFRSGSIYVYTYIGVRFQGVGSRPVAPKDLGFASAYLFGAVCPSQGKAAALIMPLCNTAAMNHHLCEISSQVAADAHAVVILDGAGWHRSQGLVVPSNITLLELPPYSPELNPVERIWHYLRSHWLANSVFASLTDIMDACEMAWNRFATNHDLIRSLCAVSWAPALPPL